MISVVMASYLGEYVNAATNRPFKLRRAIDSFLNQHVGELIVVSDGCDQTNAIVGDYAQHSNIKLIKLSKQPLFSGAVRQAGIAAAQYEWVCYLDSDDEFAPNHLQTIVNAVQSNNGFDWLYCNDLVGGQVRNNAVALCRIGTSAIVHKKNTSAVWPSGYNHDWGFIQQLGDKYLKLDHAGYIVHHVPNKLDT